MLCSFDTSAVLSLKICFLSFTDRSSLSQPHVYHTHTDRKDVTLSDMLQFQTGASKLPVCGLSTMVFAVHFSEEDRYPCVSTCTNTITFTRNWGMLHFEEFQNKMDSSIKNAQGFGRL